MHDPGKAAREAAIKNARRSMDQTLAAGRAAQEKMRRDQQAAFQRTFQQNVRRSRTTASAVQGTGVGSRFGLRKPRQPDAGAAYSSESGPAIDQWSASQGEAAESQWTTTRSRRPRPTERSVVGGFFSFLAGLFKIVVILFVIGLVLLVLAKRH